ncbi:uncharacterized protein LOC144548284 [Carex rostrata]
MPIIKESLKMLWNTVEIRILVLVSLCLQFGLVFLSPLRKRTGQKLLILVIWFFYLFADYVAILALGNLLRRQSCHHGGVGLMAFWASFLLLHLGGPDTITSYSIEDNELWWRHFLGLAVQVVIAFMVFLELVAIPRLRVAAFFVFIAGLVKYSERTWALRSSRMGQLLKSYDVQNQEQLPSNTVAPGNIYETDQITEAYEFYKIFKPFVVDHRLSENHYEHSITYFRNCDHLKAFKVVEIELSFLYDVLHTKAVLFNGLRGCIWRFLSLGMIASSFRLFLKSEKRGYAKADIIISYILFGSALFMELISLLLIITSDWIVVALKEKKHCFIKNLAVNIAKVMSCFFPKGKTRWSNSMGQYSLLSFSLRDKETIFRWILDAVKVKELWDKFIYVRSVRVPCELKELLFKELKTKTGVAHPWSELKELRDLKLEKVFEQEAVDSVIINRMLNFDEMILLWHIATDLCFHTHGAMNENPETGRGRNDNNSHSDREISLIMSNYMMYLVVMQSSVMPDGIEAKRKCQNIYNEAKNIFRAVEKGLTKELAREELIQEVHSRSQSAEMDSVSLSLLRVACQLTGELNELTENKRWRILSRVWAEMLCYAANNGKTYYHSKQLSQGGELLTHVMLLMVHMGIPQKTPSGWDRFSESLSLYN